MNRLAHESSRYLRQHADNPVDWYPWGTEAFAEARRREVPVLLSIGYASCHWCHVMAHESFEDPTTAEMMNEAFVNVKVDREERPDLDAIYIEATQAMTGSAGWPMTVFLTHDGEPFYCGTYFPPRRVHGRPSFAEVCAAVSDAWAERRHDVDEQAGRLADLLRRSPLALVGDGDAGGGAEATAAARTSAVEHLMANHDAERGGFGSAPKFPQGDNLELLLRAATDPDRGAGGPSADDLTGAVVTSLDAMAAGGIYDHLAGGFARYSTDAAWLVPHFEKMLYDQALLVPIYLHAHQLTGAVRFRQVVTETIGYVLAYLAEGGGGFCSSEDADAGGVEGSFQTWTPAEVRAVLGDEAGAALAWWAIDEEGNFEGRSIPHRLHAVGELVRPPEIESARAALLEARDQRVRPGLDDKVLTEWNALMISALAEAGFALDEVAWLDAATAAGEFLLAALRDDDGRWLRSWQADVGARHLAVAGDLACLVDAFTRLAEATGQSGWLAEAEAVAGQLLDRFWDPEEAALFTTGDDAESLVARSKDILEGATPAANGMATWALARLAALTGTSRWEEATEALVGSIGPLTERAPGAFGRFLAGAELATEGAEEVVVPGSAGASAALVDELRGRYLPRAVLAWGEATDSPLWEGRAPGRAYVCRNRVCAEPTEEPRVLADQLDQLVATAGQGASAEG